jgi:cytochrome c oxidase subunit II
MRVRATSSPEAEQFILNVLLLIAPKRAHQGTSSMRLRTKLLVGIYLATLIICIAPPGEAQTPKTISISASRFSFAPNEITVKKGEQVTLVVQSTDVTHGLVIKDLGVRTEVKKGQSASVTFTPNTAGTFEGKCAHFCGSGHGSMKLIVHVVE